MASNGLGADAAFPPSQVLEAMLTMRSSDNERKKKAHEFLEGFQKSVGFIASYVTKGRCYTDVFLYFPIGKCVDHDHHDIEVRRRG